MPIELTIKSESSEELANTIVCLAQQFAGATVENVVRSSIEAANRQASTSTLTEEEMEAPKKKKATRSKKKEVEADSPEEEDKVTMPDFLNKKKASPETGGTEDKPYAVFKADGKKFSNYADADKAMTQLHKQIESCETLPELDALHAANLTTLESFPENIQEVYQEAVDARYALIEEQDSAAEEEPITEEQAENAIKDFVRKKGLTKAKDILAKYKASKFKDLKPEHYALVLKDMKEAA